MRSRPASSLHKHAHSTFSVFLRRFGKLTGFFLLFLALIYIVHTISVRFFTIRKLEVHGANIRVVLDRDKFYDQLLFFPSEDYRRDLLSEYRQIQDIKITKKLPDTLVLDITLRKPIARLTTSGRTVLVDERGTVIGDATSGYGYLPILFFGIQDVEDGDSVTDKRVRSAIGILHALNGTIPITSITEYESSSLRARSGNTDIFIPQEGDYSQIASTLQTLFSRFRMKGTMPASVDIRFEKPVVTN